MLALIALARRDWIIRIASENIDNLETCMGDVVPRQVEM